MNEKALRTLWTALGSALLLASVAFYIRSTGAKFVDSAVKVAEIPSQAVPIYSIPVIAVLLWLTQRVAREHRSSVQHSNPSAHWLQRFPVAFLEPSDLDFSSSAARSYQRWILFLFIILPTVIELQQLGIFLRADVELGDHVVHSLSGLRQLVSLDIDWHRWWTDYRYADQQYYPLIQPWVYLLIGLGSLIYTVGTLITIFRRR
jgi:hypothetical protein